MNAMRIALSKGSGGPKYRHYTEWLQRIDPQVEVIDLAAEGYSVARAKEILPSCSGIVFTGGSDIDPALYGAADERPLCERIERDRDEFELELFEAARSLHMPILGICRGAQLINVALGGRLIVDIPTQVKAPLHHGKLGESDSEHPVTIEAGTMLGRMLRQWDGVVNSAHHQSIRELGTGLTISARSPDGIVEAIEWQDSGSGGFLIAVQWHPERMQHQASAFSRKLGEHFLFEAQSYALLLSGRHYDRAQFMSPPQDSDASS
ncbi:MAG: gamma-glutamyl-gamma-aminobutyrate hydrolase family protein [Candidatus Kapabacteria bacterium]|nr:gamma-glutamyl-gamma-aminobutyrate hydrolase family protein [Candidatus Kapabacteria bacterium]